MSVELLQTVSMALYIVAGIFFVISVVLFFFLQIPQVVGNLTGRSARKGIENIRRENASGENVRSSIRKNRWQRQQEVGSTEKFQTGEMAQISNARSREETSLLAAAMPVENSSTTKLYEMPQAVPEVEVIMELEFCSSTEIIE